MRSIHFFLHAQKRFATLAHTAVARSEDFAIRRYAAALPFHRLVHRRSEFLVLRLQREEAQADCAGDAVVARIETTAFDEIAVNVLQREGLANELR